MLSLVVKIPILRALSLAASPVEIIPLFVRVPDVSPNMATP